MRFHALEDTDSVALHVTVRFFHPASFDLELTLVCSAHRPAKDDERVAISDEVFVPEAEKPPMPRGTYLIVPMT